MWDNIKRIDDEADNVCKFVFTKPDVVVETVLYKYPTYEERTVICCSTQSGCPMGCRFCGAGDYFARNLTTEEIVSQVEYAILQTYVMPHNIKKLQIMFMSMGEPLLNLKNLIPALHMLSTLYPQAKLLISTSGPKISDDAWEALIDASILIPNVGLQFSVHETTNEARNELVPFKGKWTLEEMASMGADWYLTMDDGRKPFFNYCAHDLNSSDEDVSRLVELFNPAIFNATVSVICERNEGMPASNDKQRSLASDFAAKLVAAGYDVRVFDPAGQDTIGGGCGQLWFVQEWMRNNPDKVRNSVGHGLEVIHTPVT